MTDGLVESIVARCLMEPGFAEAMRTDRASALSAYALDDWTRRELEGMDVESVRRFSGFIGKVQHNHLWQWFPATRRRLAQRGFELDVFIAYREVQRSESFAALGREARIRSFVRFLRQDLDQRERHTPCHEIRALLDHEHARWEVAVGADPLPQSHAVIARAVARLPWKERRRLVPRVCRRHRIVDFGLDPVDLAERVLSGSVDDTPRPTAPRTLLYWPASGGTHISILELDPLAAALLRECDGERTVRAVVDRLRRRGLDQVPPRALWSLLEDAAEQGFLHLSVRA